MDINELAYRLLQQEDKTTPTNNKQLLMALRKNILEDRGQPFDEHLCKETQRIYSEREFADECVVSQNLVNQHTSLEELLQQYAYYLTLVARDMETVATCRLHEDHEQILFIGGGPLPITAIILAIQFDKHVTVLEKDLHAYTLATQIINLYGLGERIHLIHQDGKDYSQFHRFNVIYLSSFLSYDEEAAATICNQILKQNPTAHLIARSVSGAATLFYKPLPQTFFQHFQTLASSTNSPEVINDVRYLKN